MAEAAVKIATVAQKSGSDAQEMVAEHVSNEIVFAVVGHVGSGNTKVAETLRDVLQAHTIGNQVFSVAIIKAHKVIEEGMKQRGTPIGVGEGKTLADVIKYQDAGDKLREKDHAAIALGAVALIRSERAGMQGTVAEKKKPVVPDGYPCAPASPYHFRASAPPPGVRSKIQPS